MKPIESQRRSQKDTESIDIYSTADIFKPNRPYTFLTKDDVEKLEKY